MPSRPALANAVYSWHLYPPDWDTTATGTPRQTGRQALQARVDRARAWGDPIWLGELNAFNRGYTGEHNQTDPSWEADTAAFMAYARANDLGWSFWAYGTGAGSSLVAAATGEAKPELLAALQGGL